MLYQGTTKNFGTTYSNNSFYSVVALATSTDNGLSWTRDGPVISGSDPKPTTDPKNAANGADQSGAIVANGYIYDFYPYFPSTPSSQDMGIQVARAPISGDAAPGTWNKYHEGAFGAQAGLGGLGSQVVPSTGACTRPAQPWLAFSTYLNEYVMVFICEQGWFFSTSTDLIAWTSPTEFYTAPVPMFTGETDENPSLVTPGNLGQVIGQTGYVLYANTPDWGNEPHELWMRPFTFTMSITEATSQITTQALSPTAKAVTSTGMAETKSVQSAPTKSILEIVVAVLAIAVLFAAGVYLLGRRRYPRT